MHVLDFMVKSRLKILKGTSVKCMECLNEDAKKKKGQILYITMKLLLVLNCLILNTSYMDSLVIL